MRKYVAGNIIEDIATFTKDDNVTPVDPSHIRVDFTVTYGGVTYGPTSYLYSTSPSLTKLSTGRYEVQLDTTLQPGYWKWQWYGDGVGQSLLPLSAIVYPSPLLTPWGG